MTTQHASTHPDLTECRECGAAVWDSTGVCVECREFARRVERSRSLRHVDADQGWQRDVKSGGRYR